MSESNCSECNADCCKHVALEIDKPETKEDFDDIRWYVCHGNIKVYVEDGDWFIEFITPCKFLGEDLKCLIYEKRPNICKEYRQDECTFKGEYEADILFKTPEEVDEYVLKKFGPIE